MTQLSVIETGARRRDSNDRLFRFLYASAFVPVLLLVVLRRGLPKGWQRSRFRTCPRRSESVLTEARAEVNAIIAFVSMV